MRRRLDVVATERSRAAEERADAQRPTRRSRRGHRDARGAAARRRGQPERSCRAAAGGPRQRRSASAAGDREPDRAGRPGRARRRARRRRRPPREAAAASSTTRLAGRRSRTSSGPRSAGAELRQSIVETGAALDEDVTALDTLKIEMRAARRGGRPRCGTSSASATTGSRRPGMPSMASGREVMQAEVAAGHSAASDSSHLAARVSKRSASRWTRSSAPSRAWKRRASSSAPSARRVGRVRRRGRRPPEANAEAGRTRRSRLTCSAPHRSRSGRGHRRAQEALERLGAGQHDGHRAVRRARDAPHVPDDAAQGPARLDRADRRGHPQDRQDHARALRGGVRARSTATSRRRSRRSSAAAAPASS